MNARVQALIEQARIMTAEERLAALDALQELALPPMPHGRKPGRMNAKIASPLLTG